MENERMDIQPFQRRDGRWIIAEGVKIKGGNGIGFGRGQSPRSQGIPNSVWVGHQWQANSKTGMPTFETRELADFYISENYHSLFSGHSSDDSS